MVCNVDYLTIEAWIRQRLNSRGGRFEGVPVPKRCLGDDFKFLTADQPFGKEVAVLSEALENTDASICYLHPQTKLIDIPEARPTTRWKPTCNGCSTRAARAW